MSLCEQEAFARLFGTVLGDTSNANFVSSTGEIDLHFDHWLIDGYPQPLNFTNLFAMEVPPEGGATVFASIRRAYRYLPGNLHACIEPLSAVHVYNYSNCNSANGGFRVRAAELPPGQPFAVHPLLRMHPLTSENTLYVSPRNSDRVLGLDEEVSEALLKALFEIVVMPENLYLHVWEPGDLLIWDNHALLHGRRSFDARHRRRLRRLCVR